MKWCAANALIAVGDRKWSRLTASDSPVLLQLVRSQTSWGGGGGRGVRKQRREEHSNGEK